MYQDVIVQPVTFGAVSLMFYGVSGQISKDVENVNGAQARPLYLAERLTNRHVKRRFHVSRMRR
jgi:hypothetical protein